MQQTDSAFTFDGNWREFAPIALTNLLLTIVTLGFYRFWATTRERRYLWSKTQFIDDQLEWTGTGKELFIGFLLVAALFALPLIFLQFGLQAMVLRGYGGVAALIAIALYLFLLYLFGLARFRALRYRLSRTEWHGIRGGSDDQGFRYGVSAIWKPIVGALVLGLLIPWSMVQLWNERWNKMSFGPHAFTSVAEAGPLIGRFLLFYLLPIVSCVGLVSVGFAGAASGAIASDSAPEAMSGAIVIGLIATYLVLGVVALAFYAAFFREAVGNLTLLHLEFQFTARTMDWVKLILGTVGLVVVTLGIGLAFVGYRNWSFFIRHLEAAGEVDLTTLTQSTTRTPGQGEGLLDAFDVGAI